MSIPELDGKKIWCGICEAYGEKFSIEIAPSKQHPGYYHIATHCFADSFTDETKKPVLARGVEEGVQYYLKQHGLTIADISWHEVPKPILMQSREEYLQDI